MLCCIASIYIKGSRFQVPGSKHKHLQSQHTQLTKAQLASSMAITSCCCLLLVLCLSSAVLQVAPAKATNRGSHQSNGNSEFGGGANYGDEQKDEREGDRVTNLPGQPPVNFSHYAGYINLRPNQGKALFYWFFEAQEAAHHKPLVLWLNGGPGCSSVGYGAAQELGPFLVQNKDQVTYNNFSWNKAANMLFLESPVGVGYSYTNNSEDLHKLGDKVTAIDTHAFLLGWFKRFPYFKLHDFYIAGESFAGHYVPQLAEVIFERNKGGSKASYINLKGFMIGNAVINDPSDTQGMIDYAWSHAIISDKVYHGITRECNFTAEKQTSDCENYVEDFSRAYSEIDVYSIYSPACLATTSPTKLAFAPHKGLLQELLSGYDPCRGDHVRQYFNRADVQKALHANTTKLSYPYSLCSLVISKWNDSQDSILPIITKLLKAGLRIWIYSGDTDGRVPVTSTRYSINKMGLKVEQEWRAWFENRQVGGWVEVYEGGLTFATVRGAGHQVPMFAPHQSLSLFTHFLSATSLPSSSRST